MDEATARVLEIYKTPTPLSGTIDDHLEPKTFIEKVNKKLREHPVTHYPKPKLVYSKPEEPPSGTVYGEPWASRSYDTGQEENLEALGKVKIPGFLANDERIVYIDTMFENSVPNPGEIPHNHYFRIKGLAENAVKQFCRANKRDPKWDFERGSIGPVTNDKLPEEKKYREPLYKSIRGPILLGRR